MKRIAIIGGGAKAAAVCAKAASLNRKRRQISVTVFERERFGAAWTGKSGYTDGDQRLCTPAERDVGFPYLPGLLDAEGVRDLYTRFSWASFLMHGKADIDYREWVDRGRKSPSHGLYANYLRWVIRTSGAVRVIGEVTGVRRVRGKWTINYHRDAEDKSRDGYDALVVTGPGPAIKGFARPSDPRITDGVNFWRDPDGFLELAKDREEAVVIAGAGGTSATIAAWIARRLGKTQRPILIIGNQAALFTRTESFFENALFSDEEAWMRLNAADRLGASRRLNRGIVWSSVSDILSTSPNVRFRPGRVVGAQINPAVNPNGKDEIQLDVSDAKGTNIDAASLVIDAAGFDAWWFTNLFARTLRNHTRGRAPQTDAERRDQLMSAMGEDLSISLSRTRVHAPMLAQAQGPGFASLMVLGAMSERILQPYIQPYI